MSPPIPIERWKVRAFAVIAVVGMVGIISLAVKRIEVPPSLALLAGVALRELSLGENQRTGKCDNCDHALEKLRDKL